MKPEIIHCDKLPWNYGADFMRPSETECRSQFKRYSGCCCRGCELFKLIPSPWCVGIHGTWKSNNNEEFEDNEFEIFVARKNNTHAFTSWGWSNSDIDSPFAKVMFLDGKIASKKTYNAILKLAIEIATNLNEKHD